MIPFAAVLIAVAGFLIFISPAIKKSHSYTRKASDKKKFTVLEDDFALSDTDYINQYDELYTAMEIYNRKLYEEGQPDLTGELPNKQTVFDTNDYVSIEVFGFVKLIKRKRKKSKRTDTYKIKEKISTFPIYFQGSKTNFNRGFVTLPGTSIPIGGKNTLAVLCGYAKESLFKKAKCTINKGDRIIIQNIFEELQYIVTDMGAIQDNEVDFLRINKGESEIALLLCMPHSKYRFCVYAKQIIRSEDDGDIDEEYNEAYDEDSDEYED